MVCLVDALWLRFFLTGVGRSLELLTFFLLNFFHLFFGGFSVSIFYVPFCWLSLFWSSFILIVFIKFHKFLLCDP